MSHHLLLVLHLAAATVWTGGHLLLWSRYLPQALRTRNPEIISAFEKKFEPIGLPALLVQVITGIWMASDFGIGFSNFFSFGTGLEKLVTVKLSLLLFTVVLAAHARIFIIPRLSEKNLNQLAVHITLVTLTGLALAVLGTFGRYGGL